MCRAQLKPLKRISRQICPKMREGLPEKKEDIWAKVCPETSKKEFIGKETNYSSRYKQVK